MTPSIMAKANERMLSPPKMKMHNNTRKVVAEVITVRVSVLFNDMLNKSKYFMRGCN